MGENKEKMKIKLSLTSQHLEVSINKYRNINDNDLKEE